MESQCLYEEMDQTLDQLLKNEEVLDAIQRNPKLSYEKETLEKMQVSLVAHLLHVHDGLEKRYKNRLRKSRTQKVKEMASRYPLY